MRFLLFWVKICFLILQKTPKDKKASLVIHGRVDKVDLAADKPYLFIESFIQGKALNLFGKLKIIEVIKKVG